MARRSPPRRRTRSEPAPVPGWVWMLFGFGLGLTAAFLLYLRDTDAPPAAPLRTQVPEQAGGPAPVAAAVEPDTDEQTAREPPQRASRFDFYEMLPQFEVVVPEVETEVRRAPELTAVEEPGVYMLQVGSFGALKDADSRQASLALIGIESHIQRVTIDDRVYHRVRVGPLRDLDELNTVRRQLREARFESLLMRAPPE